MAGPQEVLEIAIPHPTDSTPESRRAAATRCIQALQINDYYFVRRQLPVLDRDDGQCPHCKCELVHVMHGEAFETAEQRIHAMRRRMDRMEQALRNIGANAADVDVRDTALRAVS